MARGPRIVLLGRQGAGKGTQATRLAEYYDVPYLSTGELFRQAKRDETEAGIAADTFIAEGNLVPDDLVMRVVKERFVNRRTLLGGFVFDGFPRTLVQGRALDDYLDPDAVLDIAINLEVPKEVVMHRLSGRRVCESCGANYHLDTPPKMPWICDVCGGNVVQREDDTVEAIQRRLDLYEELTVPLAEYYQERGTLVVVDGVGAPAIVFGRLTAAVESRIPSSTTPL